MNKTLIGKENYLFLQNDSGKELKIHKCCKDIIIQFLVDFESIPLNNTIVLRRQEMWRCINILKNDKFMKKYVLW